MGILSTSVLDIYKSTERRNYFGVSSISTCPRETYYNYKKFQMAEAGNIPSELDFDLQLQLLLDDGHYQESEIVDLLKRAGFGLDYVGEHQAEVKVGRSGIKGHPDGFIVSGPNIESGKPSMLEIKARNYQAFKKFQDQGLEGFPKIRAQTQLYMHGNGLPYPVEETHIIFKHKESVKLADVIEKKNSSFALPLIEVVDKIILDDFVPEPVDNPLCQGCKFVNLCWGTAIVDFSEFTYEELTDASSKWIQGHAYQELGKIMVEEARTEFTRALGESTELITDSLRIKRTSFKQKRFDSKKFISVNSQETYDSYCNQIDVTQLRIRTLDED
jgi:CRISPR/Cas system-associated exonuclease Cas4 (RecB family)